ncbi:MAG: PspC domain-containing protein [Crocinitomicaceae bacterium]|nr:PspC domain-containing protein [Crocinitomicaceae bacterium]
MKKTLSVNIKGLNFTVEEDAYELLQDYLDRLEATLGSQSGSKDILEDVELRIAELCNELLSETKTVIETADIEKILANLGNPEDYVDLEDEEESENTSYQKGKINKDRKLFRDEEDGRIGGVCSGISNYFNIDVAIIRIIFVVMFFSGFGFLLYLVLWMVVPKAKNSIDKLRMKGQPITVENVRSEVENAAEKIKDGSKRVIHSLGSKESYRRRASKGGRILSSIIGVILICFGFVHLISFLILIIGGLEFVPVQSEEGFLSITQFGDLVLADPSDIFWVWVGGLMVFLSVILFLFLLGSLLLFKIKSLVGRFSLLFLFIIGIIGFGICMNQGFRFGKDMAINGGFKTEIGSVQTQELVIIPQLETLENYEDYEITDDGNFGFITLEGDQIKAYGIEIEYEVSSDSLFHIRQKFSSQGASRTMAIDKSTHINHGAELIGDSLLIATNFSYPKEDKWRAQRVTLIIEIPVGGRVKLNDQIIHLGEEDPKEQNDDHQYYNEEGYIRGNGKYNHHSHWHYNY